jgi:hypothetical protein
VYEAKNIVDKVYDFEGLSATETVERVKYLLKDDRFMCPKEKYEVSYTFPLLRPTAAVKQHFH